MPRGHATPNQSDEPAQDETQEPGPQPGDLVQVTITEEVVMNGEVVTQERITVQRVPGPVQPATGTTVLPTEEQNAELIEATRQDK